MEGLHYTNSHSLTPTDASVTVLLAIEAAQNLELRHLGGEQAFFQADDQREFFWRLSSVHECA